MDERNGIGETFRCNCPDTPCRHTSRVQERSVAPYEVEKRTKMPNGYYLETYSLPMVVALAFRIDTPSASSVRNAILERLCLRKEKQMLWVSLSNRQPCKC